MSPGKRKSQSADCCAIWGRPGRSLCTAFMLLPACMICNMHCLTGEWAETLALVGPDCVTAQIS